MTRRELAARLVNCLEGSKLKAYWDPYGKVWTIGHGHTKGVTKDTVATISQIEVWLEEDFGELDPLIPEGTSLTRAAALLSFGLNCGLTIMKRVVSGDIQVTPDGFLTRDGHLYGQSSGNVILPDLVARRRLEAALYLAG